MQPVKTIITIAAIIWCTAAIAQSEMPLDFGQRWVAVSLSTWFWLGVFVTFGVLMRFAIDLRAQRMTWTHDYIIPTVIVCAGCGFFSMGAVEWWISKGHAVNMWLHAAIIVAATINSEVVLGRIKELIQNAKVSE